MARKPTYTVEALKKSSPVHAMPILVRAARQGRLVTYGELAAELRIALGNRNISHHHMGDVAGALMDLLLEVDDSSPLLNLIVVRADDEQPSGGADDYLTWRFGPGRLTQRRRRDLVQAGLNEVWSYPDWSALYERAFRNRMPEDDRSNQEFDDDGQPDNPKFRARGFRGGLPESDEHKALKDYVSRHPTALRLGLRSPTAAIERTLPSGDVVDVEIIDGPRRIGVEVKSILSGDADLHRGIYQCVKYLAVMVAQSGLSAEDAACEVMLVTQRKLPPPLRALAQRLGIPTRVVAPRVVAGS
ncbi:MAG TPA: hypothetical protein VGL58_09220 [Caulobacteraceae bacterium]|jgi:hypothetical protein